MRKTSYILAPLMHRYLRGTGWRAVFIPSPVMLASLLCGAP